jgi:hypothetical protein
VSDPARWTTVAGIRSVVQRRWDDGTLLRAYVEGAQFPRIDVPLRAPTAVDLGDYYEAARTWAEQLRHGARAGRAYELVEGTIGGRLAGRTTVPQRALIIDYGQAWTLLGTDAQAALYERMIDAASVVPAAHEWGLAHPVQAIGLGDEWEQMLAAYSWLDAHRGSGLFVRQLSAPGVDTKFVERHRGVLAAMLGVAPGATSFVRALGLAGKPATVRMRFDAAVFGLPAGITEATFRAEELRRWNATPRTALIVENEISYLSAPVPAGSVVLWGKGFDVAESVSLEWLGSASVSYWGDLDTHGFAILNRVRAHRPEARSVLMDRQTLLAHEDRWGREPKPTAARLPLLTPDEASLYADLVSDRYAPSVRLEQEVIDWAWAFERLAT